MVSWANYFVKFPCDPVVACGGVAVFIQESAKSKRISQLTFHKSFIISQQIFLGIIL